MLSSRFWLLFVGLVLFAFANGARAADAPSRPNVVIILADDKY